MVRKQRCWIACNLWGETHNLPYLTPQTNPTDFVCRVLRIPNDPLFIANVTGALEELTFAYNWELFGALTPIEAKDAMLTMFNAYCFGDSGDCLSPPQFRQQDNCLLQISTDGGSSWDTVFDASTCVDTLVKSGRYGQFGPDAPNVRPLPTICDTRRITLYANTPYQSPFLLKTGDTVNITVIYGVWSGTLNAFADTHCADGGFLDSFAQCGGSADPGHLGDPLPSADHMRLVMEVGGVWYDAYNASFTVPAATVDATLTLQPNDDVLLDNTGYAILDIEVCTGGSCDTQDLTSGMGIWNITYRDDGCGTNQTMGVRDSGGVHSVVNACFTSYWDVIDHNFGSDVIVRSFKFHIVLDGDPYVSGGTEQAIEVFMLDSGGGIIDTIHLDPGFQSGDFAWTGSVDNVRTIALYVLTNYTGYAILSGLAHILSAEVCWQ